MNFNEFYSFAATTHNAKRPSKTDAYDAVQRLIEQMLPELPDGETLHTLATINAFFMPPLPAKPKSWLGWLGKAIAKKDDRYYLCGIYAATEDTVVATDGKRLHMYTGHHELEVGCWYNHLGHELKMPEGSEYPDYTRVIPSSEGAQDYKLSDLEVTYTPLMPPKDKTFTAAKMNFDGTEVAFNDAYLKDAISFMSEPYIRYHPKDTIGAVIVMDAKNPTLTAILMPVRV